MRTFFQGCACWVLSSQRSRLAFSHTKKLLSIQNVCDWAEWPLARPASERTGSLCQRSTLTSPSSCSALSLHLNIPLHILTGYFFFLIFLKKQLSFKICYFIQFPWKYQNKCQIVTDSVHHSNVQQIFRETFLLFEFWVFCFCFFWMMVDISYNSLTLTLTTNHTWKCWLLPHFLDLVNRVTWRIYKGNQKEMPSHVQILNNLCDPA